MRPLAIKIIPVIALALFFLPSVPTAHAAGLTEAQVQAILGLLQSFGADANVIANVQVALGVPGSVGTPNLGNSTTVNSSSCVALTHTLTQGSTDASTGGDVTRLQQFLGVGGANGYFGPATLKALQAWQAGRGIASSGVTGYGTAGPKTRAAMACKY